MSTEADIRTLITHWVDAIVGNDLDGVTANHSDDIVMFDVPQPYNGVRGMTAYRASWPPFFGFLRSGATFELLELNVEAGEDVVFGYGLLRCSGDQEFAENPDNRLRLTLGLRKIDDAWSIVHEHH